MPIPQRAVGIEETKDPKEEFQLKIRNLTTAQ